MKWFILNAPTHLSSEAGRSQGQMYFSGYHSGLGGGAVLGGCISLHDGMTRAFSLIHEQYK